MGKKFISGLSNVHLSSFVRGQNIFVTDNFFVQGQNYFVHAEGWGISFHDCVIKGQTNIK